MKPLIDLVCRDLLYQRRYVALVAGFALLSLAVHAVWPGALPGGLRPVQAVPGALVFAGLSAALPGRRARLGVLALVGTAPVGGALGASTAVGGTFVLAVWLLLALIVYLGLTGPWFDRLTLTRSPVFRAHAASRLPAQALWAGLVPTRGQEDAYCDAATTRVDIEASGPSDLWLDVDRGGRGPLHGRLITLEVEVPFHIRVAVLSDDGGSDDAPDGGKDNGLLGFIEMSLVDLGDQRLVLVRGEPQRLGFGDWVQLWLDDSLGRDLHRRLRALAARAQDNSSPLAEAQAPERV